MQISFSPCCESRKNETGFKILRFSEKEEKTSGTPFEQIGQGESNKDGEVTEGSIPKQALTKKKEVHSYRVCMAPVTVSFVQDP